MNQLSHILVLGVIAMFMVSDIFAQDEEAVTVTNLHCEYRTNPLGIDPAKPRLSWTPGSDVRGQKQTAYQILVATSMASDNWYRLYVMNRNELAKPIDTHSKKIALYDVGERTTPLGSITTAQVLDRTKLPFDRIKDFKRLNRYDVLVIGRNSMDNTIDHAGEGYTVTRWVNPNHAKDLTSIELNLISDTAKVSIAGISNYLTREKVHD